MPLGSHKAGLFGASASTGAGDRGLYGGGWSYNGNTGINVIGYVTISSTGDAADFGDMSNTDDVGGCANGASGGRAIWDVGNNSDPQIQYVTVQSAGNAADFGDRNALSRTCGVVSNGSNDRGIFAGGRAPNNSPLNADFIEYVTISSTGNGADFGNLSAGGRSYAYAAASNGTDERGVFAGGEMGGGVLDAVNVIEYLTISSTGNTSDFGDLSVILKTSAGTSNDTNDRMLIVGGNTYSSGNTVTEIGTRTTHYITITSTGNSTDFGDLTVGRSNPGTFSNGVNERAVAAGGATRAESNNIWTDSNVIDYFTINSTGNAADFGDTTVVGHQRGGVSDGQA